MLTSHNTFKLIHLVGLYANKEPLYIHLWKSNWLVRSRLKDTPLAVSPRSSRGGGGGGVGGFVFGSWVLKESGKKRRGSFGKSMTAWNIAVVHLKGNTSSIKQTWRTGPIHQRAAWISYWVQLRRDKCRISSVCPRLPIDRDHHCDVAFYLTTCSLKPYIILFPTQRSQRRRRGEKGTSLIVSFILRAYRHRLFKLFSWLLMIPACPKAGKFDGSY